MESSWKLIESLESLGIIWNYGNILWNQGISHGIKESLMESEEWRNRGSNIGNSESHRS